MPVSYTHLLGQPNFVKAEMVKEGAVIIDVGTTRVPDATKKSGFKMCIRDSPKSKNHKRN